MRILIVGASGDVGTAARKALEAHHEIVAAGRNSGEVKVDLMDPHSIRAMFAKTGTVDAVVATAGHAHYGPLVKMTEKDFRKGLDDKLMGQINLVLLGLDHVSDGGSITLTTGSPSCGATRMFDGLRSRWMMPLACACWTAWQTERKSSSRLRAVSC